jgi:hypothetical protein
MQGTQFINLEEYKAVVEKYIFDRKGVRVKIVFDDLTRFNLHFKALVACHDEAVAYYKNNK